MGDWIEEILSPELLHPNQTVRLVKWLRAQPLSPEDRKLILVDWCDYTGVPLTRALVLASQAE